MLYIIAGHGAGDPGACAHGYSEAERVRALGQRMADMGGGQVLLCDTSRNWYADGGISSADFAPGAAVLELHMDSAGAGARGGHVIKAAGTAASGYDYALESYCRTVFPGRANTLVYRSDLANPNRAKGRGLDYRLLECCFISDVSDLDKFNRELDALAAGYLSCFGIGAPTPQGPVKAILWPEASAVESQWWRTVAAGNLKVRVDGAEYQAYRLVSPRTGQCMAPWGAQGIAAEDYLDGTQLIMEDVNELDYQCWVMIPFAWQGAANACVIASAVNPSKVIAFATPSQGEPAVLWSRNNLPGQILEQEYKGADLFAIKDAKSGLIIVPNQDS